LDLPGRVGRKQAEHHWSDLAWARLGSLGRDPLELLAWVSVGALQLSLFSFVYSLFTLLFSFFPKILKLTQIWE